MEGDGHDIAAVVEGGLDAVAVVGVDVEEEDTLTAPGETEAGEDNVVDVTEAGGFFGEGVVKTAPGSEDDVGIARRGGGWAAARKAPAAWTAQSQSSRKTGVSGVPRPMSRLWRERLPAERVGVRRGSGGCGRIRGRAEAGPAGAWRWRWLANMPKERKR